jgi:hypothetical protein
VEWLEVLGPEFKCQYHKKGGGRVAAGDQEILFETDQGKMPR